MNGKTLIFVGAVLLGIIFEIAAHGRLMWPASRTSIWRHPEFSKFDPKVNYNDNEHNCGGFGIQHGVNGGKCGECGDDYRLPRPRPTENGGEYGRGIIVGHYAAGQIIEAQVQLTANHLGYFQFRLCALNDPDELEEQSCLDQNLLKVVEVNGEPLMETKVPVPGNVNEYYFKLQLPADLSCSHCVLQWHYLTGNSWGWCDDGTGALGCGETQETFRACADIAIN